MKVIVVGGNNLYGTWISKEVEILKDTLDNIDNVDLVVFTGGADVDPSVYGQSMHPSTGSHLERDLEEIKYFKKCVEKNIPMLGICRGSQFLTAMQPNGRVIQDVNNHAIWGTHNITFNDGDTMSITSTHHQMMYPFNIKNYEIIAWSEKKRSSSYWLNATDSVKNLPVNKEPEVVFYPDTKCLAIQGHPEYMDEDYSPVVEKLRILINEKLL